MRVPELGGNIEPEVVTETRKRQTWKGQWGAKVAAKVGEGGS